MGYMQRTHVPIGRTMVVFKPDEEGGYRTLKTDQTTVILLETSHALAETIAKLIN